MESCKHKDCSKWIQDTIQRRDDPIYQEAKNIFMIQSYKEHNQAEEPYHTMLALQMDKLIQILEQQVM